MRPVWAQDEGPNLVQITDKQPRREASDEQPQQRSHPRKPATVWDRPDEEQRAHLSLRPPRVRRWRELAKLDAKADRVRQRLAEAHHKLQQAEAAVQEAPAVDARTLAEWMASGEKGKRPPASLPERERDAARLAIEALTLEFDRALAEYSRHVAEHRGRLVADAQQEVAEARDRLVHHITGIAGKRRELLDARETLRWAATFPEPVEAYGFPTALAIGLQKPVRETLQTSARVEFRHVLAALEADAAALAEELGPMVMKALGQAPRPTPEKEAMWWGDEDYAAYRKEQVEHARRLAAAGFADPDKLAREIADRP